MKPGVRVRTLSCLRALCGSMSGLGPWHRARGGAGVRGDATNRPANLPTILLTNLPSTEVTIGQSAEWQINPREGLGFRCSCFELRPFTPHPDIRFGIWGVVLGASRVARAQCTCKARPAPGFQALGRWAFRLALSLVLPLSSARPRPGIRFGV